MRKAYILLTYDEYSDEFTAYQADNPNEFNEIITEEDLKNATYLMKFWSTGTITIHNALYRVYIYDEDGMYHLEDDDWDLPENPNREVNSDLEGL